MSRIMQALGRLLAQPEMPLLPGERRREAPVGTRGAMGARAEQAAAEMLRRKGLRILCRNRVNAVGELDIVAREGDCIVFVEVRARGHDPAFSAHEAVTARKLRQVAAAAEAFLRAHRLTGLSMRLDVVGVELDAAGDVASIEHLEDVAVEW